MDVFIAFTRTDFGYYFFLHSNFVHNFNYHEAFSIVPINFVENYVCIGIKTFKV